MKARAILVMTNSALGNLNAVPFVGYVADSLCSRTASLCVLILLLPKFQPTARGVEYNEMDQRSFCQVDSRGGGGGCFVGVSDGVSVLLFGPAGTTWTSSTRQNSLSGVWIRILSITGRMKIHELAIPYFIGRVSPTFGGQVDTVHSQSSKAASKQTSAPRPRKGGGK